MRGGTTRIAVVTLLMTGLVTCASHTPTPGATPGPADVVTATATERAASVRQARLEPGPQSGFRFAGDGAVLAHKQIRVVNTPASVTVDRRWAVPGRPGFYLHVTSGRLTGYDVLESPVSYIVGLAGSRRTDTPQTVTLAAGRYLAYRFDAAWQLGETRFRTLATAATGTTQRRAVIDGRPYLLMSSAGWVDWWMPIPRPRGLNAQALTCEVPSKPAAGTSQVLRRVATDDPEVALTFDLGGRLDPALDIVRRLVLDRVCATVHPTGATALTTGGTAVLELLAAHPELFEVGNHTMHHCNLVAGGEGPSCPADPPTTGQIQTELTDAESVIRDLTGWEPAPFWRPPYGAYDSHALSAAAAVGYTKTLMWDVDTIDWEPTADGGPTAASMQDKVALDAVRGSIVLMHLGGYHTLDALPGMVLRLRQAGLTPTTVSDLLD
ncbi:MAG: polysaccharide deacetylase family protein [Nocardioidaceae bacterium]